MFSKHTALKRALQDSLVTERPQTVGVHGTLFDISEFDHPGGTYLLRTFEGCDITPLFETHHINARSAEHALQGLKAVGTYHQKFRYRYERYRTLRDKVFAVFPTAKSRRMTQTHRGFAFKGTPCINTFTEIISVKVLSVSVQREIRKSLAQCLARSKLLSGSVGL